MNEEEYLIIEDPEYEQFIKHILEANPNDFFEAAKILNINITKDLAGSNLSKISLKDGNLKRANLRKADFTGTDLSYADLSYADLTEANLTCADLSYANLENSILTDANVENAIFRDNQGLSLAMQNYLLSQGALIQPQVNKDTSRDEQSLPNQKKQKEHKIRYLAFIGNQLVKEGYNKHNLLKLIHQTEEYQNQPIRIEEIQSKELNLPTGMSLEYYQAEFLTQQTSMHSHEQQKAKLNHEPKTYIEICNPSSDSLTKKINAFINTGAVMTCVPESALLSLGALTYSHITLKDFQGQQLSLKTYYINIKINDYRFEDIEVIAIPKEYAVIGRDILKNCEVIIDPTNNTWRIKKSEKKQKNKN
ncbi:MAG: pentapeptide repeat-containing protein [Crocosphaera sp.]|nr:pentapeptide repeat-containing protein [Crocosphaera sp.]